MAEEAKTLGDALPREMARVRDQVMPAYQAIGDAGAYGLHAIRGSLDNAAKAMAEGDVAAMARALVDLQGYQA